MRDLKKIFPYTIPILIAYTFIAIGFYLYAKSLGIGLIWACLMNVIIYSGTLQFVTVGVLAHPIQAISFIFLCLLINIRHVFYGFSFLQPYKNIKPLNKRYLIYALTDESYSLLSSMPIPEGVKAENFYFYVSLLNQLYWCIGTFIGFILSSIFPIQIKGIDFLMTALFVSIFLQQWQKRTKHFASILGITSSFFCLLIFKNNFVLPAMILNILALYVYWRKNYDPQ